MNAYSRMCILENRGTLMTFTADLARTNIKMKHMWLKLKIFISTWKKAALFVIW